MPIASEFHFDRQQRRALERLLADIPNGVQRVERAAIKRTGEQVKTRTLQAITGTVNVKRKDIDANKATAHRFGGVRLNVWGLNAEVSVTGRRIPVYRFGAKQIKKGVSYKIEKGGGKKRIESGFIATMESGHTGAFARVGKARFPIDEKFGPSIPHVADESPEYQKLAEFDAGELLEKNTAQQVERYLERAARG
jgi:hypothetical protein